MRESEGSYILLLTATQPSRIQVGKLGRMRIEPGCYVYCGSAMGPGGLRARITRHLRRKKANRWHIDFLREVVSEVSAWYLVASNEECDFAADLLERGCMAPMKGFGSSDCRCYSHLLWSRNPGIIEDYIDSRGLIPYQSSCPV